MSNDIVEILSGQLMDEAVDMSLAEVCQACGLTAEQVLELVEHGVAEPSGRQPSHWRFSCVSVRRIHCAQRLQRDLGINLAGAALALDLLDELERMRQRLRRLEF